MSCSRQNILNGVRLEFISYCLNEGGWVEGKQNYCQCFFFKEKDVNPSLISGKTFEAMMDISLNVCVFHYIALKTTEVAV